MKKMIYDTRSFCFEYDRTMYAMDEWEGRISPMLLRGKGGWTIGGFMCLIRSTRNASRF